jgi:hypothetical protein
MLRALVVKHYTREILCLSSRASLEYMHCVLSMCTSCRLRPERTDQHAKRETTCVMNGKVRLSTICVMNGKARLVADGT